LSNRLFKGTRNPSRIIPERLKEAREARGYTLESFAEALQVTRQALAQFETGQTMPSSATMGRIVGLTTQPLVFFMVPSGRSSDDLRPFWRSLKRMEDHHRRRISRRLQWTMDVAEYVSRFIELPEIRLPTTDIDPDRLTDEDIENAAMAVRDIWRLGRGPAHRLVPHFEDNGIVVVREPVGCEDMDAVSCWQAGRPFVLLSSEAVSGPRDAYNLAHELGHLVLHSGAAVDSRNLDRLEKQANRFAGAFLLPAETFSKEIFGTSIEYFKLLKKRWGVSIAAMAYRCRDLGLLSKNQHVYLIRQMNALRIREVEPLDDAFEAGAPSILSESLKMLVEAGVQTRAQIREALAVNPDDLESICGTQPGFLSERVIHLPRKLRMRPGNEA